MTRWLPASQRRAGSQLAAPPPCPPTLSAPPLLRCPCSEDTLASCTWYAVAPSVRHSAATSRCAHADAFSRSPTAARWGCTFSPVDPRTARKIKQKTMQGKSSKFCFLNSTCTNRYSKECQALHWPTHKKLCKPVEASATRRTHRTNEEAFHEWFVTAEGGHLPERVMRLAWQNRSMSPLIVVATSPRSFDAPTLTVVPRNTWWGCTS